MPPCSHILHAHALARTRSDAGGDRRDVAARWPSPPPFVGFAGAPSWRDHYPSRAISPGPRRGSDVRGCPSRPSRPSRRDPVLRPLLSTDRLRPRGWAPTELEKKLPLLGLSKDHPSTVPTPRSPLPGARSVETALAPFGKSVPTLLLVPSSCFPSTSTACSFVAVRACCSALPAMGFTAFPRRRAGPGSHPCRTPPRFPAMRSRPPKSSPCTAASHPLGRPAGACHRRRGHPRRRSPRPLPLRRLRRGALGWFTPSPTGTLARTRLHRPGARPLSERGDPDRMRSCLPIPADGSTLRPCSMHGSGACPTFPPRRPRDSHGLG